jgi:UMF1 family MFS transporter
MGRVSGWGWSLGYLGGLMTLGLCLLYINWAEAQGQQATRFVPITMLITAGIFALASLPTFLLLHERAVPSVTRGVQLRQAWLEVWQTLSHLQQFSDLRRFLLCSLFYHAGIQTVITLTAIYASQAMKFTTQEILLLVLVVNITAAIGAFLFGFLQDRIGHVRAIALTLLGWILAILLAWSAQTSLLFWTAANIVGLCLGASQSGGRAVVGLLAPPSRLAEFFGFWGLAIKLASIAGPLSYGATTWLTDGDHRRALLFTGSYFVAGLLLLSGVSISRGRRAALQAERRMRKRVPAVTPDAA